MNNNFRLLILALSFNVMDFITSYVDLAWYGMNELNAFALMLHLGAYLALFASFILYQSIVVFLYILSIKYPLFLPVFMVFALFKVLAVVNNLLAIFGFDDIALFLMKIDYGLLSFIA